MKTLNSPLFAPSGASMAWLRGAGALASRLYVYLSGFLAVFLMAAQVAPARFGAYSIYQSVLEVALVVGTLGSMLLFSRNAAAQPPRVFRGDVLRTLAIGLPLGTLLMVVILAIQRLPLADLPFALLVATLALFSFNCLRLAYTRGLGQSGLMNLEAGLRSTILVAGVLLMGALGLDIDVAHLLAVNLFAFALVCGAILWTARSTPGAAPPPGPHAIDLPAQTTATIYSLLTFLLRKSDLLIVAFFMPLSYVGAFKLAFLLAEAPSQFVQAFLLTKTTAMLGANAENLAATRMALARRSLLLGCALFVGLGAVLTVAAPLLKLGDEARNIFFCMAPYFLLRTYTIHHEMVLQLVTPVASLGRWALLEVALRLASYAGVVTLFPHEPHYVFFVAVFTDFALYEVRMRAHFGFFPLVRLLRPAR